jgi:hypothetical protein
MKLGRFGAIALPVAAVAATVATAAIPLTANAANSAHSAHAANSAHATHVAQHQSGSAYAIYNCANQPQVHPGSFDIFCDGSNYLSNLKWSQWGGTQSVADGVEWIDNCTPNCAAGKWSKQSVIAVFWQPKAVPGHKGKYGYVRMTLLYPATGRLQNGYTPGEL